MNKNEDILYKEACDYINFQLNIIKTLQEKNNWLLVANLIIIGFLLSNLEQNNYILLISISLFLISSLVLVIGFWVGRFNIGPKLKKLSTNLEYDNKKFKIELSNYKIKATVENRIYIKKLVKSLKVSIIFIIIGLVCLFISINYNFMNHKEEEFDQDNKPIGSNEQLSKPDEFEHEEFSEKPSETK